MRLKSSCLIPISRWQRESSKGSGVFFLVGRSFRLSGEIHLAMTGNAVCFASVSSCGKKKMQTCVSTLISRKKNAPKACRLSDTPWQPFIPKVYQSISERNRIFIGAQPESDTVGDRGICFASGIRLKLRRAIIIIKKKNTRERLWGIFLQQRRSDSCFTPDAEPLRGSQTEARR